MLAPVSTSKTLLLPTSWQPDNRVLPSIPRCSSPICDRTPPPPQLTLSPVRPVDSLPAINQQKSSSPALSEPHSCYATRSPTPPSYSLITSANGSLTTDYERTPRLHRRRRSLAMPHGHLRRCHIRSSHSSTARFRQAMKRHPCLHC